MSRFRSRPRVAGMLVLGLLGACLAPGARANGHNLTYYGVENDPDKSESANKSADAAKQAGSANDASKNKKVPVKQSRTGAQILSDLDKLAQDHGTGGKLEPGLFIFHYSGHGDATVGGPAVIGEPPGPNGENRAIDTNALIDKILSITTEDTKILLLLDSCGAGNLKVSLDNKIGNPPGKSLRHYFAVMGTRERRAGDPRCPAQFGDDIGSQVKDGLAKGKDGKPKADENKDGKVSLRELGSYAQANGDGFTSSFFGTDAMLDMVITGTELVNGVTPTRKAAAEQKAPANRSASQDSIHYDGVSQEISFTDHFVVDTGFPSDPLEGAELHIPTMRLLGQISPVDYLFQADDPAITIQDGTQVLLSGALAQLVYNAESNEFLGEILGPGFPAGGSPWLDLAEELLTPGAAGFDPDAAMFFGYQPELDFLARTQNLSEDGSARGADFVIINAPVAEPQSLLLFGPALLGLAALGSRRRIVAAVTQGRRGHRTQPSHPNGSRRRS